MSRSGYLWSCVCIALVVLGCNDNKEAHEVFTPAGQPVVSVAAVAKPENTIASKDFFENVSLTPLETTDSILIGGIQKLVYHGDEYYIADSRSQRLLVFDQGGRFARQVGKQGKGPGEYENIRDFEIDQAEEELLLYSSESLSLFVYKLNGEFKRREKLNFFGSSFELLGKDKLMFYTNYNPSDDSGRYNVLVTDRAGKILQRGMPFPETVEISVGFSGGLKVFGEDALYSNALSDTLWVLNSEVKKQKAFLFDFEGRAWKYGYDFMKLYEPASLELSHIGAGYFMDEHFLFATILDKRRGRQVIYDRKAKETYNEYSFSDSFLFKLIKIPGHKIGAETYLTAINAQSYSGLKVSYPDEWTVFNTTYPELSAKLEQMLDNEENPAVVTFSIRK